MANFWNFLPGFRSAAPTASGDPQPTLNPEQLHQVTTTHANSVTPSGDDRTDQEILPNDKQISNYVVQPKWVPKSKVRYRVALSPIPEQVEPTDKKSPSLVANAVANAARDDKNDGLKDVTGSPQSTATDKFNSLLDHLQWAIDHNGEDRDAAVAHSMAAAAAAANTIAPLRITLASSAAPSLRPENAHADAGHPATSARDQSTPIPETPTPMHGSSGRTDSGRRQRAMAAERRVAQELQRVRKANKSLRSANRRAPTPVSTPPSTPQRKAEGPAARCPTCGRVLPRRQTGVVKQQKRPQKKTKQQKKGIEEAKGPVALRRSARLAARAASRVDF